MINFIKRLMFYRNVDKSWLYKVVDGQVVENTKYCDYLYIAPKSERLAFVEASIRKVLVQ